MVEVKLDDCYHHVNSVSKVLHSKSHVITLLIYYKSYILIKSYNNIIIIKKVNIKFLSILIKINLDKILLIKRI